jgi:TrmH family RNA methyltransferase
MYELASHNTLKHLKKLHQKKYRKEFQEAIIEGKKGVKEALLHANVTHIFVEAHREEEFEEILNSAEKKEIEVSILDDKDIAQVKTTETYPGVSAIWNIAPASVAQMHGPIICLDRINDPGNLGTIIRTADWFGIEHILTGEGSVDFYNPKTVRSTMGSCTRQHLYHVHDLTQTLTDLKSRGYTIYALDMNGESYKQAQIKKQDNVVLLFGSESHGIASELLELADHVLTIPRTGNAESLNVGIAVGVVVSELR